MDFLARAIAGHSLVCGVRPCRRALGAIPFKVGRLQPLPAVLALALLTAASWALARILNQGLYYWLLKDYPVLDRSPTRIEKQASVKQHGVSYKNIAFLCFPVATFGIFSCALTMLLGAIREDLMLWTLGALVSGVFWYAFGRELFVE